MSRQPLEDPKTGVHRAKLWEIAFYALNNTSTNAYMILVGSISYFLVGIVGVAAVLAGSIVTIMRIWDGVTDPFIGMLVDNTNTRFGKNRPFILLGNLILFGMTWLVFHIIP
ncbi:MAG: MFS transporter, partial [Clostridia bacterium]|nr:MFS transporter [Clostridia bacterium]